MANGPIDYVCGHCGSRDVSVDAWADWNVGLQDWVVRETFPVSHCHDCEGETSLVERELAQPTG